MNRFNLLAIYPLFLMPVLLYDCSSCSPKIHVKADGTDQPITGQYYDQVANSEITSTRIGTAPGGA